MADPSFAGGRFAIMLEGAGFLGFVKKLSGGLIKGELAEHQLGPGNVRKKHIASISYEDITVDVGMGMAPGFYEWIQAAFDSEHISKNGEIHACDFDLRSMSIREFRDAHISEVTIPALDGSSKDPAYMTVKLSPGEIEYRPGTGGRIAGEVRRPRKKWRCSNFRFELGDLPCRRVARIDSFAWKMGVIKDEVGAFRIPTKHPARIEVPNLRVTVSMADLKPWEDWHRSFVIEGNCGEDAELDGAITFLGRDPGEELARIDLINVGILSLDTWGRQADKEEVSRFIVELYVEEMRFEYLASDA
jgi:hypothetical protein